RVADLRFIAREAVSTRGSVASIDNIPDADADDSVDQRVGGARVRRVTRIGERDNPSAALRHPDSRIREVVTCSTKVTLQNHLSSMGVDDEPRDARTLRATVRIQRGAERAP